MLSLSIPTAVGSKLYPSTFNNYTALDIKLVQGWKNVTDNVELPFRIIKDSNGTLRLKCGGGLNTKLDVGLEYYFRYEATFLLSDSLLS